MMRMKPGHGTMSALLLLAAIGSAATHVSPPAASAATAGPSGSPPPPAASSARGTLGCSQLEALWEAAGGSPSKAFIAAEVARAESGGQEYATDNNTNGSTDRGYWQINSTWGVLSTYTPLRNAEAAVQISTDGNDWSPWVTYQKGLENGQC
jgi:hypothetical protein